MSVEACVGRICCQAQERAPEEGREQQCTVEGHFDIGVGACSFGSRVGAESSLSEGGGCCFGTEALHKLRPYYDCRLLEVFQRWTMLS